MSGKGRLFTGASSELLPGEIAVARATNAQQLPYTTEVGQPVSGCLTCTNYRIAFAAVSENGACEDIPLASIHQINLLSGGGKHRKLLDGRSTLPRKISEFEVLCKDLRRVLFSVRQCSKSDASSVVNAVARHTHPSSVSLLFAFDHAHAVRASREDTPTDTPTPTFFNARDWQRELDRLSISNDQWRVSEANKHFLLCGSLCPHFVCPSAVADSSLEAVACPHSGRRLPVWCWSHPLTGTSLTRAAAVEVDDQSEAPDPEYMRGVANARHSGGEDATRRSVKQCDVNKYCGTVRDVQHSYARMQELCMPTSPADLAALDRRWLVGLEVSGWLLLVRACLALAKSVANHLCIKHRSIMLLEDTGRDLSCVVSSLVQLMADTHCRSVSGFQALVQKEWVAMGYPFTTRHALIITQHSVSEDQAKEAPVFLLFLDCVWQLLKQFPSAFEFSELFLLHLHDMAHGCLYGTFIFDCARARVQASTALQQRRSSGGGEEDSESFLLSAWSRWRDSLTEEESEACLNPLYYIFGCGDTHFDLGAVNFQKNRLSALSDTAIDLTAAGNYGLYSKRSSYTDTFLSLQEEELRAAQQQGLLLPETSLCSLRVWSGYFFRHMASLCQHELPRRVVQQLEGRLVKDVRKLKDELNELELTLGSLTSDLTSFLSEVLQCRDTELQQNRKASGDTDVTFRPRLSAVVYSYEDPLRRYSGPPTPEPELLEETDPTATLNGRVTNGKPPPHPSRVKSLAQFTDDLYRSEHGSPGRLRPKQLMEQRSLSTPAVTGSVSPTARSPVTKTRLRVVRGEASDPVLAPWQRTPSPRSEQRLGKLTGKIIIRKDSWDSLDESTSQEHEITEL